MEQNNTQTSVGNQSSLREILFVLKKNIILLLAVIFVAIAVGSIYAYARKPSYIATEKLLFRMGDSVYIADDINTMSAYKTTVQSFANQGKVVDRANYYATKYYEYYSKGDDKIELDAFIGLVESLEGKIKSYADEKEIWGEIIEISTTLHENTVSNAAGIGETLQAQRMILYGCTFLMQRMRAEEARREVSSDSAEIARLNASIEQSKKQLSKLLKKDPNLIIDEDYLKVIYDARHYDFSEFKVKDDYNSTFAVNFIDKTNYNEHQQACKDRVIDIDNSIKALQTSGPQSILYYDVENEEIKKTFGQQPYIVADAIGINPTETDEKSFVFSISYTDGESNLAQEKVKLLTLAFNVESSYFFTAKNTTIDDLGLISCSVDISKAKIILIATAIGVVLGIVAVYLVYVFDKTIKTKEDAEKIAGCSVLACIESKEV